MCTEDTSEDIPEARDPFIRDGIPEDATPEEQARILMGFTETDPRTSPKWTIVEQAEEQGLDRAIRHMITLVGDDPEREGLLDTPDRVIRSWRELYAGYDTDVGLLFTQFDSEEYSEMIILEGIEFQSMCEHHMLPFYGQAWVAYIPNEKVVGISKLVRVVEAFSKRLQNQERITSQVTEALETYLKPLGAACVLKGHHMCMGCRGVRQPSTVMTTSSLTGAFKADAQTRNEFLSFVNKG
jgi:GTP cyclohydrolase I